MEDPCGIGFYRTAGMGLLTDNQHFSISDNPFPRVKHEPRDRAGARRLSKGGPDPQDHQQSGENELSSQYRILHTFVLDDSVYDFALESMSCGILPDMPFFSESFVLIEIVNLAMIGNQLKLLIQKIVVG
jgi:hypothetical protein